jgi:hypothetical protein
VRVQIDGLKDFNRSLRRVDAQLPKVTRQAHAEYAREVRDAARSNARSLPGKSRFARLISSSAGQNFAAVRVRAAHPAAAGWVFGAIQFRQFRRWVGKQAPADGFGDFGPGSYAVSPAIRTEAPRVLDEYHRRVQNLFKLAYPGGG